MYYVCMVLSFYVSVKLYKVYGLTWTLFSATIITEMETQNTTS